MLGFFRSPASPGKVRRGKRGQAEGKSLPINSYSIIAHCTQSYAWKKKKKCEVLGECRDETTALNIRIMYKASPG